MAHPKIASTLLLFTLTGCIAGSGQGGLEAAPSAETFAMLKEEGDWQTAPRAMIDRFSSTAGHLQVRDATNGLPGAGQPVNFDQLPFVTDGLGPLGERLRYYNFDVQSPTPARIYTFYRNGAPVPGQLPILAALPGEDGYSDFHQEIRVTVPQTYVANSIKSAADVLAAGLPMAAQQGIWNFPVVPEGSTANFRIEGEPQALQPAWINKTVAFYFIFGATPLKASRERTPTSPIYVMFNINPDQPQGGPGSGFRKDAKGFSHNVTATIPGQTDYSPLWSVSVVDNAAFETVVSLPSALKAKILATNVATVNCPVGYYYPGLQPTVTCTSTDSWTSYAQDFFARNCSSCHGAQSELYFVATSQTGVEGYARDIAAQIGQGTMPPSGGLPQADRDRIVNWLNCTLGN